MKTPRQQIIKKYTRAFLQSYKSQLQPVDLEPLSHFAYFLKHHQTLAFFAHNAISQHEKKVALYIKAFSHRAPQARPEFIEAIQQLITILADHGRLSLLSGIIDLIVLRFFGVIGYQHATITTAIATTEAQQKDIVESFKILTGKKIDAKFEVDPELIAGMRIISQDYLWDSTLAQKIKALAHYKG
ncbi:MAG: F0F1 ATP synthase subunit delta [Candidatus Babeliaceae bacterium]|nr:F0F1 ATP synthase subunit delta [Candidatus Babeliaceae bacterium]